MAETTTEAIRYHLADHATYGRIGVRWHDPSRLVLDVRDATTTADWHAMPELDGVSYQEPGMIDLAECTLLREV